jgi:hypothetical protein
MPFHRMFAAAAVTLAALGLLAAIALGAGGTETPAQPSAAPKPEVRTVVIHRTVRVHRKAKRPVAPAPVAVAAPSPAASSSGHDVGDDHGGHGDDDDHSGHGGGDDD